jgi:nitrite reductase (NADH) large subunit
MSDKQQLVVIGNGMAGVACVEQVLRFKQNFAITIFGDERHVNYNRILLSSVLAGERSLDQITINDLNWYDRNGIALRAGVRIVEIDRAAKTLLGEDGSVTPYDKLIIATGPRRSFRPLRAWTRKAFSRSAISTTPTACWPARAPAPRRSSSAEVYSVLRLPAACRSKAAM